MPNTAIIIANSYRGSELTELLGVGTDATGMHHLMEKEGGYRTTVLLDKDCGTVMKVIQGRLVEMQSGDHLLIYFAGHANVRSGEHLLYGPEARRRNFDLNQGTLPVRLLRNETEDPPGIRRTIVLDCCRNSMWRDVRSGPAVLEHVATLRDIVGTTVRERGGARGEVAILLGCSEGEHALELPHGGGGLLTQSFIRVAEQFIAEGRVVDLGEEFQLQLREMMKRLASEHGLPAPVPHIEMPVGGTFALIHPRGGVREPRPPSRTLDDAGPPTARDERSTHVEAECVAGAGDAPWVAEQERREPRDDADDAGRPRRIGGPVVLLGSVVAGVHVGVVRVALAMAPGLGGSAIAAFMAWSIGAVAAVGVFIAMRRRCSITGTVLAWLALAAAALALVYARSVQGAGDTEVLLIGTLVLACLTGSVVVLVQQGLLGRFHR